MSEDEDASVDDLQFLEEVMEMNETLVNLSENDNQINVLKKRTEGKLLPIMYIHTVLYLCRLDYLQQSSELLREYFDKGQY